MKNLWFAGALLVVMACVGCSSKKSLPSVTSGEIEVSIPLSGPEYQSNAEYWRAVQLGSSKDMSMAKKIAMQNARQELASTVQQEVKSVIENYGKNARVETNSTNESVYNELSITVVQQQMNGVTLAGEKLFKLEDGSFRYHVCLQLSRVELEKKLADALSKDARLQLEFDRAQFKKVYDEEMKKHAEGK